jgi:hypothetical protein
MDRGRCPCHFAIIIGIIILKSTNFANHVVQFVFLNVYHLIVKIKEEDLYMNTDKIIAESIAKDYAPKESSKIVALKKLDNKAKLPATVFTYSFGIGSALVFGTGMCLAMQVIGSGLAGMILGIMVGIAGLVGCGINYPIYKKMLEKGIAKYAYEIVELARQISEE